MHHGDGIDKQMTTNSLRLFRTHGPSRALVVYAAWTPRQTPESSCNTGGESARRCRATCPLQGRMAGGMVQKRAETPNIHHPYTMFRPGHIYLCANVCLNCSFTLLV